VSREEAQQSQPRRVLEDAKVRFNNPVDRVDVGAQLRSTDRATTVRSLAAVTRNANRGLTITETAAEGLSSIRDLLVELRSVADQATSTTLDTGQRNDLQAQADGLVSDINDIATETEVNGLHLLDGSLSSGSGSGSGGGGGSGGGDDADVVPEEPKPKPKQPPKKGEELGGEFRKKLSEPIEEAVVDNGAEIAETGSETTVTEESSGTPLELQVGTSSGANDRLVVAIDAATPSALAIDSLDLSSTAAAESALEAIDAAVGQVDTARIELETTSGTLTAIAERATAHSGALTAQDAASQSVDARADALRDATAALVTQANIRPDSALRLLG